MTAIATSCQMLFPCVKCQTCFQGYKTLLEHLYWRHGTESVECKTCDLRRWVYADHICHVLPIDDDASVPSFPEAERVAESDRDSEFCYCGKVVETPMIGCDGPQCVLQWYHFSCVGIGTAPPGQWFCPECCAAPRQTNLYEEKLRA